MVQFPETKTLSWADWLTLSRMATAPLLIVSALIGAPVVFVVLAAWGFLSDMTDGRLARRLSSASDRGARLDSRADFACYSAVVAGVLILIPNRVAGIWELSAIIIMSYFVPIIAGWLKFRKLTAYHTVLARVALVLVTASFLVWVWLDLTLPLQLAAAVLVVSSIEELAITWVLDAPLDNVQHFGRVRGRRALHSIRVSSGTSTSYQ